VAQWLEVARLEDTTRERYEDLIRLYVTRRLGELGAAKLDAEILERFYARLQRAGRCALAAPPPVTCASR
jgi:integrase